MVFIEINSPSYKAAVVLFSKYEPVHHRQKLRGIISVSRVFLFYSPIKFVGGDCWPRGPTLTGCPSLLAPGSSVEQPMEVSTTEQMDTSSSGNSEASAPLPIRHPSGVNVAPYKKQAYPMNSKRPEHLRMNL